MKDIVKEQLKKVTTLKLPSYNDNTTHMIIKMSDMEEKLVFEENNYYLISLQPALLNPSSSSALESNYNEGRVPKHQYYKCEVKKILGQMIKIFGLAYDLDTDTDINETWTGWLPINSVDILQKL